MTIDSAEPSAANATPAVPPPLPPLSGLLDIHAHREPTHHWVEAHLPVANRARAALRVAIQIVWLRCGGAPQFFDAWAGRYV